jgi:hypothetical protein
MVEQDSILHQEQQGNTKVDKQAVETKLRQAEKSIQMALEEVSLDEVEARLPLIHSCINCAHSYLIEASDSTGRRRQW